MAQALEDVFKSVFVEPDSILRPSPLRGACAAAFGKALPPCVAVPCGVRGIRGVNITYRDCATEKTCCTALCPPAVPPSLFMCSSFIKFR